MFSGYVLVPENLLGNRLSVVRICNKFFLGDYFSKGKFHGGRIIRKYVNMMMVVVVVVRVGGGVVAVGGGGCG